MTPRAQKLASATLIVGVFVFWEVFCLFAGISELILPRPSRIIEAFLQYGFEQGVCQRKLDIGELFPEEVTKVLTDFHV